MAPELDSLRTFLAMSQELTGQEAKKLSSLSSLRTFLVIYLKAGRLARLDYLVGASKLASFLGTTLPPILPASQATTLPSMLISYEVQELAKALLEANIPGYRGLISLEDRLARLKQIEQEIFKTVLELSN